ncbi:MAG TPA: sensor histidine kinase KdpD [Gaiellales bacterium]|jgi:two-component system sensor histidine kinase KdpD
MRGRFRILLGAAAGVGKTYRMLQEGRSAATEGVDVVIGYLEPHDRPETAALAEGLETVPRRRIDLQGVALDEMDVDAVVRRAPELALIDELAHTNAPGSRNQKRYQDIEAVLDGGIDVISTVNVQHLESLNDTVFELTGVRVRETFPDRILDEADEVVLVDLAPQELQERLRAGKVYAPARVETALANFFRTENLGALRQLALRELSEDVEARRETRVIDRAAQQAILERILVLVTPQPSSQRLMRRAWRSSQRLGADVDVLWVRRGGERLSEEQAVSLAALRRLAAILGAHFLEEEANDVIAAVRAVVIDRGTTYLYIGTPERRRLEEVARGSFLARLIDALPGIDIRIAADRGRRRELLP